VPVQLSQFSLHRQTTKSWTFLGCSSTPPLPSRLYSENMKSQLVTALSIFGVIATAGGAMAVNSDALSSAIPGVIAQASEVLAPSGTAPSRAPHDLSAANAPTTDATADPTADPTGESAGSPTEAGSGASVAKTAPAAPAPVKAATSPAAPAAPAAPTAPVVTKPVVTPPVSGSSGGSGAYSGGSTGGSTGGSSSGDDDGGSSDSGGGESDD